MSERALKFSSPADCYVVLKMDLSAYRPTKRKLEEGYEIHGAGLREKVRRNEGRLLTSLFEHWSGPYEGKLKGWRPDSPLYVTHRGRLVAGVYLCSESEFGEPRGWGQLHYAFMHPSHRGRGIYSVLFNEAVEKAREWGLKGLVLNSDRHVLPEVYLRWGAVPWKEIPKKPGPRRVRSLGALMRRIRKLRG